MCLKAVLSLLLSFAAVAVMGEYLDEPPLPPAHTVDPLFFAFAFLAFVILLVILSHSPSRSPFPPTFTSSLHLLVPIVQAIPGVILVYFVFFSSVPSTG